MKQGPSFIKGLVVTMGLYLIALPVILIPLVGIILAITLIPYLAAALGIRFADPRERLPLALTTSILWSSIITFFTIIIMRRIASISPMGFQMGNIAWFVIISIWIFNLVFTILGALYPWRDPFASID